MAKASVERSRGADWYLVSKTPLTGAKTISQKVRVNCWATRGQRRRVGERRGGELTMVVKMPFSEWNLREEHQGQLHLPLPHS